MYICNHLPTTKENAATAIFSVYKRSKDEQEKERILQYILGDDDDSNTLKLPGPHGQ